MSDLSVGLLRHALLNSLLVGAFLFHDFGSHVERLASLSMFKNRLTQLFLEAVMQPKGLSATGTCGAAVGLKAKARLQLSLQLSKTTVEGSAAFYAIAVWVLASQVH